MAPEVSIVIPVFQDQAGLDRCLKSIAEQVHVGMSDFEVIVVDNGSEPPMTFPESLPFSVQIEPCAKKGAYSARNVGVRVAKGKALAFLDADCWPSKTWLRAGLDALSAQGGRYVIGGEVLFDRSSRPRAVEAYQLLMGFGQERAVNQLGFSATANLFVTRDAFERTGWFNEELLSGGDREWSWRAFQEGVPVIFAESVVVWTHPRRTLKGALIQARRVAGGRKSLGQNAAVVSTVGNEKINPEKGLFKKVGRVLGARQFPLAQRLSILGVAILIRIVHDIEMVRIRLGAQPERR